MKREVKQNQFARIKLHLNSFADKKTPSGKTSYPFKIQLPDNLPPTVFCKSAKIKGLLALTKYSLIAELDTQSKITQEKSVVILKQI